MAFLSRIALCLLILCLLSVIAWAGGPLVVGGAAVGSRPRFGVDGKPFTWDPAKMPIAYRVDPGPMAVNPSGTVVIDHNAGLQRVQSMFGVWQAVSTANISFTNAGALLPAGSYTGGDLKTAQQFNDVMGSCRSGAQSPVIFDADGKLMASLGLPAAVIGFNSGCALDASSGMIVTSAVTLNGQFQDEVQSSGTRANFELPQNSFDEAIVSPPPTAFCSSGSPLNSRLSSLGGSSNSTDRTATLDRTGPERHWTSYAHSTYGRLTRQIAWKL